MKPFLKQVAEHYLTSGVLAEHCFVFPSRRSMVFFKKYLSEIVADAGKGPLLAPLMMTVSDFFEKSSPLVKADRICQLLTLYECYRRLYPGAESLDEFIFWGDVILGDFSDVDKYMADPKSLFTNVADLKAIEDSYSYMTDVQKEAIRRFVKHFDGGIGYAGDGRTDVKQNFSRIWNILLPLYNDFHAALQEQGLSSEGHLYRTLAIRCAETPVADILAERFPRTKKFVFVGLTAPNACEKAVFRKMKDASLAEFCWDYSGDMIKDPENKSSFFISQYVEQFGQAFRIDPEGLETPRFNVVKVPSAVGQTKILPQLLDGYAEDDCAVVLPDENLLFPLLDSIPQSVGAVNVTMGCPMNSSGLYSLMRDICRMQLHMRVLPTGVGFYHKQVWDIFSDGLFKQMLQEDEAAQEIIRSVKAVRKYYVPQEDLGAHPLFSLVFRPVIAKQNEPDADQIRAFTDYLAEVVAEFARRMKSSGISSLEMDFAKDYWCSVVRLAKYDLPVLPSTFVKMLDSLLGGVSVPFNGEPLKGLQVMGPLETRLLDFRNVVILSANEGTFPRKSLSSSFVPAQLRKAFDLPTYEFQDAMWAYYFYRLICRAENVWLVYDSRTEGMSSGEESRFIKQLIYHYHLPVTQYVASADLKPLNHETKSVKKTPQIMDAIHHANMSASRLNDYRSCPLKFYYEIVERLGKEDEVSESLDNATLGDVYHNTMRALFMGEQEMLSDKPFDKTDKAGSRGMERVSLAYLREWLGRKEDIRRRIRSFICSQLGTNEVRGRDLVTAKIIERYVLQTIKRDIELLETSKVTFFEVVGLELPLGTTIDGFRFSGYIDRVDRIGDRLRVVDYKTGSDDPECLKVVEGKAEESVDNVFSDDYETRLKYKATFQFYIYDRLLSQSPGFSIGKLDNSMYATQKMFNSPIAVYPLDKDYYEFMGENLSELLAEIDDMSIPFSEATDQKACKYCDFKMICGK